MAFLMLMYQKMKLQRKENRLTLKQLQFSSKVDRMQKKVDKRQKYYDKLKKQIERQANAYKSQANIFFNNMSGLGMNSVNLSNPYGSNAATMNITRNMSENDIKEAIKQYGGGLNLGDNVSGKVLDLIRNGGIRQITDKDGATKWINANGDELNETDLNGLKPAAVNNAANIIQQMASMQVSQMTQYTAQMKSNYENNVSIWQQAAEDELEAREEWEMDLLSEEQADMEAEKNSIEMQLKRVQEEKQNIEQALDASIKDSAPKFGVG